MEFLICLFEIIVEQVHISKESCIPDHCRPYALSDPNDPEFQAKCSHKHLDLCDRCNNLKTVLNNIDEAISQMPANNADVIEELAFVTSQAKQAIHAWKAHILRNVNQDEARTDALEMLEETSVLLVQDWAMKFLPRKYRESQTDWFGKRGISWHITVAIHRAALDQEFHTMTFVHVFQSCNQDSCTVLSIMKDVVSKLKKELPNLESVYYRQDNAGCYHCGASIAGASLIGKDTGVFVRRMDFSDPQGGKGACDRKAASIKSHMKIHLNTGNNIETGREMVAAMLSSGGIPGVNATLAIPPTFPRPVSAKLEGVSAISNIEYTEDHLRVWRAYGIGPGKIVPLSKTGIGNEMTIPDLSDDIAESDQLSDAHFIPTKGKTRHPKESSLQQCQETADELSCLYSCPEEGCMKTYQRFSALQHHLDCGRHTRALEHETLLDKAAHGYSDRLQGQSGGFPELPPAALPNSGAQPSLPMGWALKSSQGRRTKRFTDKQKNYLFTKFSIGEATGQKADPALVAKAMMTARNFDGERLFTSSEFLTSRQVASYFSRLASKRTLNDHEREKEDSDMDINQREAAENEDAFSGLRSDILGQLAISHPIYYDCYNLCELIKNGKISNFAIPVLQDICRHFEIPLADITKRRKAPYIDRIVAYCKDCPCHSDA